MSHEEKVVYPRTEQLIIRTSGKSDDELGIRFLDVESQWSRGFRIKETIKLENKYEFMFILEREIK